MSAKRAKGLTRKITLDHALSYDRTVPNRRGVTALAELNGTGAYARRYKRAKRLLENGDVKGNPMAYTAKQKTAMKRMSKGRRASFAKMLAASGYRRNPGRRGKYQRNDAESEGLWEVSGTQGHQPSYSAPAASKKRRGGGKRAEQEGMWEVSGGGGGQAMDMENMHPSRRRGGRPAKAKKLRAKKAEFMRVQEATGHSHKKALSMWKAYSKRSQRPVRAVKVGRGRYTGIVVKGLGKPRRSYMYKSKSGVRHIPEYAVLGYKSPATMKKADATKVAARRTSLSKHRARLAKAEMKRIMQGRGMFSPNAGEVLSFEEWKKMNANKKRAKKAKKGKGRRTAAQRAATRKLVALNKKRAGKKAPKRRKTAKKRAAKKMPGKKLTKHQIRVRAGKKAAATRRRRAKAGGHAVAPKRRKARKGKGRKHTARRHVARKGRKHVTHRRAAPKRRKAVTHRRRGRRMTVKRMTISMYAKNRRRYHRNMGSQYVSDMKDVLKIGAVVVVGYAIHRGLSKVFDEYALGKVESLKTGSVATWRPLMSAAVVAAVGIPLTAYLAGKTQSKNLVLPIAAGMAASLLHNALLTALGATGNASASKVAGYLSAYPDAGSRAYNGMGSYYSFQPRQVFGKQGTGEFYEVLPQSGFGLNTAQLNQAAAGFGGPVMQAAAGFGAEVMQAAAGTGEYVVYGAEGIGEYEEVPATGGQVGAYDGILPSLNEAEYALNVAEAAAGLGDLSMQSTVDPVGGSQPIAGAPGGSRAGVLQGGDGIFGG